MKTPFKIIEDFDAICVPNLLDYTFANNYFNIKRSDNSYYKKNKTVPFFIA